MGRWADEITFDGTDVKLENDQVINGSDVSNVFFGGQGVYINYNTVISEERNHGVFAGIAVHTGGPSDISGLEIIGNTVINRTDTECGGLHAGINIRTQMWGPGCWLAGWGNVGYQSSCSDDPPAPESSLCSLDRDYQVWAAYIPPGDSLRLEDNYVQGNLINYLIEGLDNRES